jgi:carboxyl-terminal processing protease
MRKKVSIFVCLCACLLTAIVTLAAVRCFALPRTPKPAAAAEDKLAEAAQLIRENFIGEYSEADMTDAAIAAMVYSLNDRWSYYMTAEEMADYLSTQNNRYGGIGIVLRDGEDGIAEIYKVYAHSPAGEAGVPVGCRFLTVGGRDVTGENTETLAALIREDIAAGKVELCMLTPAGEELACSLIPGEVYTEPVSSRVLASGLGCVKLENFEGRSAGEAIEAVKGLLDKGVSGIIFDVRDNPGGLLSELLDLLDYLLPEGKLFISRYIDGTEETEVSDADCVELPMAVLVNGDTYSAAEFFAAALREYGWAQVVGTQTSGKGYAQITVTMRDGSAIHISHMAYYTPSGVSLAGVGLTPDLTVEMDDEARYALYYDMLPEEEDPQLQAAVELLSAAVSVSP